MAEGKTVALIVAAGRGERAAGAVPKQYAPLGGRPLLAHSLVALTAHPGINEVRVVIGEGQQALFSAAAAPFALPAPITGGATRRESVRAGLEGIARDGAARVLIHDAARPFLTAAVIDRLLAALEDFSGAVPVLPVVDSLAHGGETLGDAARRDGLVRVQTPQAFRFAEILAAHRAWPVEEDAGDDAQVARAAGIAVATVAGDARLAKVTHAADFAEAEERLSRRMVSRSALGFDVHAFAEGDGVWLCGLRIPHDRALAGHSDADVGLHAITDALLGTIGEGDIGAHFPPSDPQWRGAASSLFVEHAVRLIAATGGRIDHVDVTLICEAPKIGLHRAAMRIRLAQLLSVPERRISVKATTTERLGFTGRGEGIAAQAIATVSMEEDR